MYGQMPISLINSFSFFVESYFLDQDSKSIVLIFPIRRHYLATSNGTHSILV